MQQVDIAIVGAGFGGIGLGARLRGAGFDSFAIFERDVGCGGAVDARVLVTACGQLRNPYVPEFQGLDDFEGDWWHSARWNHDVDLRGKRVAVVGTGATSIQVVPELAGVAGRLDVFQRTPPWVVPRKDRADTRGAGGLLRRGGLVRRCSRGRSFWRRASRS